jgi:hypothetical protein
MTLTDAARAGDPENTLVMETEHGAVVIEIPTSRPITSRGSRS